MANGFVYINLGQFVVAGGTSERQQRFTIVRSLVDRVVAIAQKTPHGAHVIVGAGSNQRA